MICTIEQLQKYSGVYTDEENKTQEMYLGAAENIVENYLGYYPILKSYKKVLSGSGFSDLRIGAKPIISLERVVIDGIEQDLNNYIFDDDSVICKHDIFPKGRKNICIDFIAGYETVPELIKLTILRIAALLMCESDSNIGITSKSFGDSGTRVFQNYTNFDKYLLPISCYKLL